MTPPLIGARHCILYWGGAPHLEGAFMDHSSGGGGASSPQFCEHLTPFYGGESTHFKVEDSPLLGHLVPFGGGESHPRRTLHFISSWGGGAAPNLEIWNTLIRGMLHLLGGGPSILVYPPPSNLSW